MHKSWGFVFHNIIHKTIGRAPSQHCRMMLNAESMLLVFPCSSIRCHCGKCNVLISNETLVSCMVRAAACCGKTEYMCGRAHKLIFTAENALSHSPGRQARLLPQAARKSHAQTRSSLPCTDHAITFQILWPKHVITSKSHAETLQMDPISTSAFKVPIRKCGSTFITSFHHFSSASY